MNTKPLIQKHVGTFRYDAKEIYFHFWSHLSNASDAVDTVIFLGSGQSGKIAQWVAKNAPSGTVIVEGLPHKKADRSANDLKEFVRNYTETALLKVLETFNISTTNIIAESQAAPGVIWAAGDHIEKVNNIALIAPLGFTAHLLGNSPRERLKELKKRGLLSALQFAQSPLHDPRNFYLHSLMLYVLLFDTRWKVSGQKYAIGASHDLRQEYRVLADQLRAKGCVFTFILGTHDKLFPPDEIMHALRQAGIPHINSVVLDASHTSLAIRDGRQILSKAVQAVRQKNSHNSV